MAIEYWVDNMVMTQTFREHIDLDVWLRNIVDNYKGKKQHVWEVLKMSGQYFGNPLKEYPKNIKTPERVERGRCHHNNLLYAQILYDNHRDILCDFKFVTGVWLRKAKWINPYSDTNYCGGPHSFLTYQGNVLDCGAITNPPDFYEITQYFGISFEIQHALESYSTLEKAGIDTEKIPIIEVLTKHPIP